MPDTVPQNLHSVTTRFYDANPALEHGRLEAHRIEFEVTLRTILEYLSDGHVHVLDVGCGTGPYSYALASRGHNVTLIDISSELLSLARTRFAQDTSGTSLARARLIHGDALALSTLLPGEASSFPVVLLLGPLYHIMSPSLREDALCQAWCMVKPGGVLICSWVSRWAHYRHVAVRDPTRLGTKPKFYEAHALNGDYVKSDEEGTAVHAMNHERPANMPVILRRVTGEEDVSMVGTEGVLAGGLDKMVNELRGDAFEVRRATNMHDTFPLTRTHWVRKCLEVGRDEYGWMMSDHILGIVRKST